MNSNSIKIFLFIFLLSKSLSVVSQNLSSSLTACYNFNGNTIDAVNGLNGGYLSLPISSVHDRFNQPNSALEVFYTSSVTILPSDNLIRPTSEISCSGWVKFSTLSSYAPVVFTRNNAVTSTTTSMEAYQIALKNTSSGHRFMLSKSNSATTCSVLSTTQVLINTWYHFAFTIDNSSLKIYINGNLEGTTTSSFTGFDYKFGRPVVLGFIDELGYQNAMNGYIDNFRFYNRALTANEVNQLFVQDPVCFLPPSPPTCNFYYALSNCAIYAYRPGSTPTPTYVNVLVPDSAAGITIAPNLGYNAPNPTYWLAANGTLWYFDGNGFVNTNHSIGNSLAYNLGSGKNYIFCYDDINKNVYKYNGTSNSSFVATHSLLPFQGDIIGDDLDNYYLQNATTKDLYKYDNLGLYKCLLTNITIFGGNEQGLAVIQNSLQSISSGYFTYSAITPPFGALTMGSTGYFQPGIDDLGSCPMTTSIGIIPLPPSATLSCPNPSATIQVSTTLNDYYNFTFNGIPVNPPAIFTATAPGVYTLNFSNGCRTQSASLTYTVHAANIPLTLTATPSSTHICFPFGNAASLSVSGATYYNWSPNMGLFSFNGSTVLAKPTVSTIYTITGQTTPSCISTTTIQLNVIPSPTLIVSLGSSTLCLGETKTVSVNGATNYTWHPVQLSGAINLLQPQVTTQYTIIGESLSGCTSSVTITLGVYLCASIDETIVEDVKIMPNPCIDFIQIEPANFIDGTFFLYSITGELLDSGLLSKKSIIEMKKKSPGFYNLILSDSSNKIRRVVKLVKE